MESAFFTEIYSKLEKSLDHERFVHTLGVAFTSASLAMRYHADVDQALLAGLLHDCAKCFPTEEKFALCREGGVELTDAEVRNPALIHARLGAYIAERDYDVHDPEILDAIRSHTTGQPGMTLLQKIVFTADLIEPDRDDRIPDIDIMRELAFTDIDEAVCMILERSLEYLAGTGKEIDPTTQVTFDYYNELLHTS